MNDVTQTWENKLLACLLNIFVMFRKSESLFFVNMKYKFLIITPTLNFQFVNKMFETFLLRIL